MAEKIFNTACRKLDYRPATDLFASEANRACSTYYSRSLQLSAAGTNAFRYNWREMDNPYANPPWTLIPRVLAKVINDKVEKLMIVVPHWIGAMVADINEDCYEDVDHPGRDRSLPVGRSATNAAAPVASF